MDANTSHRFLLLDSFSSRNVTRYALGFSAIWKRDDQVVLFYANLPFEKLYQLPLDVGAHATLF